MAQANVVNHDDPLVTSLLQRIHALPSETIEEMPISIYRVPEHIRKSNQNCYEPRMVAIGPYHRGRAHLLPMEELKLVYLQDLLSRFPVQLRALVTAMRALEPRARACYFERIGMDNNVFAEMMLLDGCFVIQVATKWAHRRLDSILGVSWSLSLIVSDLLMLDNQIPFFILERLYNLLLSSMPSQEYFIRAAGMEPSLMRLLVGLIMFGRAGVVTPRSSNEIAHLLHLYHYSFVQRPESPSTASSRSTLPSLRMFNLMRIVGLRSPDRPSNTLVRRMIPTATELKNAGVIFKKKTGSLVGITFGNGVLSIPHHSIDERTKSHFVNLIAFEQCNPQMGKLMTSFAIFMDCIVCSAKDIAILQESGIIENKLSKKEEAVHFYNLLRDCSYIDHDDDYFVYLFKKVRKYCESDWHKYRAMLYNNYFNSPWSILSVVAAVLILALTALHTIYVVYSYYHHRA